MEATKVENQYFYPRSPCGERPRPTRPLPLQGGISIHALLAESDGKIPVSIMLLSDFYPRSPCGERQSCGNSCTQAEPISIHALLAESDRSSLIRVWMSWDFYPRSPCGERPMGPTPAPTAAYFYPRSPCGERPVHFMRSWTTITFLSTLSLRRATRAALEQQRAVEDFYPRSPCGERHRTRRQPPSQSPISIHALLAESDLCGRAVLRDVVISIHALLAESDPGRCRDQTRRAISIHALLAESDAFLKPSSPRKTYFYPRSPCGERQ